MWIDDTKFPVEDSLALNKKVKTSYRKRILVMMHIAALQGKYASLGSGF